MSNKIFVVRVQLRERNFSQYDVVRTSSHQMLEGFMFWNFRRNNKLPFHPLPFLVEKVPL